MPRTHPLFLSRFVLTRPRLWFSIAVGGFSYAVMPLLLGAHLPSRLLLAWNIGALLYLALAARMMARADTGAMQRRARQQSEGRVLVLAMVVAAAVAVLLAVASQLSAMKDLQAAQRAPHVALAALTVITSWSFTQTLFALNYAHDFYMARERRQPDPLLFPGTPDPNYADFFYFACVIGTSGQTADVAFQGRQLRPVGTLHCVLAFFFNTTVLALTINIAAGLF